jgi:hypothetical protein
MEYNSLQWIILDSQVAGSAKADMEALPSPAGPLETAGATTRPQARPGTRGLGLIADIFIGHLC